MAQNMVETFARGLIDQILLEAFDQNKVQSKKEVSYTHMQHSDTFIDYKGGEEKGLIGNIVDDLRGVQIGDTSYLLSSSTSVLEQRQSKRGACFMDNTSIENTSINVVEMSDIQGQGDVEPITFDSESSKKKPVKSTTCIKEIDQSGINNDPTKVSINLLHRMIEELETVTEETISNPNDSEITKEKSKEDIAVWEEKEEKLIRIIEDNEGSRESIIEETRSMRQFNVDDDREELKSSMMMSGASSSRNLSFDEVYIEENTSDYQQTQQRITNDDIEDTRDFSIEMKDDIDDKSNSKKNKKKMNKKKKNKESLGRRLKRFFLKRFKRGKN